MYVSRIGHGSRSCELYLVIHPLTSNDCWKYLLNLSRGKMSFLGRIKLQENLYFYTYILFILFEIVERFQKRAWLQRSFQHYNRVLLIFQFVCVQSIYLYKGTNHWIVDFCSVDLPSWNWRGVGKAMNFMVILQGVLTLLSRCLYGCISTDWNIEGILFYSIIE